MNSDFITENVSFCFLYLNIEKCFINNETDRIELYVRNSRLQLLK